MRESSPIQFILRNLGWLAASVFLALVIWIAANMANNPVQQREISRVPLRIVLPDGMVLSQDEPPPSTARAVVRAQASDWDLLTADDILLTADLTHITRPGEYRVELEAEVATPRHGRVVAIRPSAITVIIDEEAEKRVPVRVIVSQEPPLGYSYPPDLVCDQTEVVVRGSAERVASVEEAQVRLVLSDDLNPVVKQDQPLIPVQANGREVQGHVTLIPETVNCPVDIRAREDVVQMRVLPTIVGEPPEGYLFGGRVVVDPPSVGVTGDRLAISQLTLISTEPIDLSDQTETFTAEVALDLPPGVNVMAENETVRVTVTITSVPTSRRFDGIRVEVAGLDSSLYHYSGLPETVTVTVVGPPSELPEREDVRVIVDLSGLPAGNHQVTPQGLILGEDELDPSVSISVLPQQLSVTIEAVNPTATPSPTPTAEAGAAAATLPPPSDNEQPGADVITATPAGQP